MKGKKRIVMVLISALILLMKLVAGPPPTPHPVAGMVYSSDEVNPVPSGTNVRITDLNNSAIADVLTWGPIPPLSGAYSTNINGVDGHSILARAWNSTDYGEIYTILQSTTTFANIVMNMSRSSETYVQILYPGNDSLFNTGDHFNVTVNISFLGSDATACNATINFSEPNIFLIRPGETETLDLGDIDLGSSQIISWNLSINRTGSADITVISECETDGVNFEGLNIDTIYNITNVDLDAPEMSVMSPANNTRANNPVFFYYNVTDVSGILNCSLYVNDLFQDKVLNPPKNQTLNFSMSIGTKTNTWKIMCTDDSNIFNEATAGLYNLTINDAPKIITSYVEDPIDLVAAGIKSVSCNGTVTDPDGYEDVIRVNATIFNTDLGMTESSQDNKSTKLSNASCALSNGAGNNIDFNCTFDMEYYALNGTWECNITAVDYINTTNTSKITTEVNQLLAIGIIPTVLDYRDLKINEISGTDILANVTNYGNVKLDMELFGYAVVETDNLSMDCTTGSIGSAQQRFNLTQFGSWDDMSQLKGKLEPNAIDDFDLEPGYEGFVSYRMTYWKLKIPEGVGGTCNGKIVFTALLD
ncbi:MAG: hypothetical protein KKF44_09310 [Nanoarchaeota archaeon]|nr:hypothetical protein [Nanoarchaeota archaeon]